MLSNFQIKKRSILTQLEVPDDSYSDLSPKGSVDADIRSLVDEINALDGFVTTSSCAGRIAVYVEGQHTGPFNHEITEEEVSPAEKTTSSTSKSKGGKGGGEWLYVSHEPIQRLDMMSGSEVASTLGLNSTPSSSSISSDVPSRLVRLKFEPFILHVLTSSLENAQHTLSAAMSAGFRESGISGVVAHGSEVPTPIVAVRTNGLAFDSIVATKSDVDALTLMVSEKYLSMLLDVANQRFEINAQRIERFRRAFLPQAPDPNWEPSHLRRERKRQEGLKRQAAQREIKSQQSNELDIGGLP